MVAVVAGVVSCCTTSNREFKIHMWYTVGSSVVMLDGPTGGGTGFHVIAPSGKVYLMSNRHVCADADKGMMTAHIAGRRPRQVKVIQESDSSDLCLLEAVPGVPGLKIGDLPATGDEVMYVGHPRLQPSTFVSGDIIGTRMLVVNRGEIDETLTAEKCKSAKDSYIAKLPEILVLIDKFKSEGYPNAMGNIDKLQKLFGNGNQVDVCYERDKAMITTLEVYPGASGSPVVNVDGELVGVIYAGSPGEWGYAVIRSDINKMLNGR